MPFPFTCPSCRHTSQVLDSLAGSRAKCPTCGDIVQIPTLPQVNPTFAVPVPTVPTVFVDEDAKDDGEFPTGPARRPASSGGGALAVLLILGALLLLGCGGVLGVLAVVFYSRDDATGTAVTSRSDAVSTGTDLPGTKARTTQSKPPMTADARTFYHKLLKSTPWLVTGDGRRAGVATAIVVDRDERLLLTNYHVVGKFEQLLAMFPEFRGNEPITQPNHYLESAPLKGLKARLVASDAQRDLAVLQVDLLPADVEVIPFAPAGASEKQPAMTLGAQGRIIGFGNENGVLWRLNETRVTRPVQREYRYKDGQRVNARVIEIPAQDDPNDFGGPVLDEQGRLLGVTADLTADGAPVTCAIDVTEARAFIEGYFKSIGRRWSGAGNGVAAGGPAAILDEDNELPSYWITVLREPNEHNAEKARAKLTRMGRGAVLELRKGLRDPEARFRRACVSVLGAIGEPAGGATEDLTRALSDAEPTVRTAAAQAIGRIGPTAHAALVPLLQAASDPQRSVRDAAIEALERIGPPTADDTAALAALWKEPSPDRRTQYLAQVRKLKPKPDIGAVLFVPLLADSNPSVRLEAIRAVGECGPAGHSAAFARLMALADDLDEPTSKASLAALAKLGPATANDRQALESGLRGRSTELRQYSVIQMGALGDAARGSVPDIARLLRDPNPGLRTAAASALGRIGKPAVGVLAELLTARQDRESAVRVAAVETLGKLGRQPGVVPALFDSLDDDDPKVRTMGSRALQELQPRLGADDQRGLQSCLKSRHVEARRLAAAELARLGTDARASFPYVREHLNDADYQVRRHLFAVLAAEGTDARSTVPVVLATMTSILDSDGRPEGSLELFRQASVTLTKIGDPVEAVPIWAKGLKTRNRAMRKEVVQSLVAVGPPARKAARELCATLDDPEIAAITSDALVKLGGDEIVRALCELIDEGPSMTAKLAAIRVVGRMGPAAKDAYQTLFKASARYRGKELGEAARESLKLIQKKS